MQAAGTTRQDKANAGAVELRLANVRKLHPIYLGFSQELHLGEPPAKSLTSIPAGGEPQLVQALEGWMDAIDAKIQARELRLALQNTKLATSEPGMHALLARYLGKEMKTVADKAKIDFLLAQYFAFSAPAALHNRPVSLADVAGVLQPILGPFPVKRSHWVDDIEKLVSDLADTNSLRDVRERGIIERGRTIKAQMGDEFARPEHLIACTRLNYLLRRRCSELMKLDLRDIDASLEKLVQRGVSSLDCSAAQLAKVEPIPKLRETCRAWTPPTSSDYAAAPPFTRVLALLSIVDEALHKAEQAGAKQASAPENIAPAADSKSQEPPRKPQERPQDVSANPSIADTQGASTQLFEEYQRLASDVLDLKADFRAVVERLRESMGEQADEFRDQNKRTSDALAELKAEYGAAADRFLQSVLAKVREEFADKQARVGSELSELKAEYKAVTERLCEVDAELKSHAVSMSKGAQQPQPAAAAVTQANAALAQQTKSMASNLQQAQAEVAQLKAEYHAVVDRLCELEAQLQTLANSFSRAAAKQAGPDEISTKAAETTRPPAAAREVRQPVPPPPPVAGGIAKPAPLPTPPAPEIRKPAQAAVPQASTVGKAAERAAPKTQEGPKATPSPKTEASAIARAPQPEAERTEAQPTADFNSEVLAREEQLGSALRAIEPLRRRIIASNLKLNGVTVFLTASEIRAFLEGPTTTSELVRAGVAARCYLAEATKAAEKSGCFDSLERLLDQMKEILATLQAGAAGADAEALMETSKLLNKNLTQVTDLAARMKAPKETAAVAATIQQS